MARITNPTMKRYTNMSAEERKEKLEHKWVFKDCKCFKIDPEEGKTPENLLCFSEGCIGALSNNQDKLCNNLHVEETPKALQNHLNQFRYMGEIMHVCMKGTEGKEEFYNCVEKEAGKK